MENPFKYPGALLLDEISHLPKEEREKVNYAGVCSLISQEIAARAIRRSMEEIIEHSGDLED